MWYHFVASEALSLFGPTSALQMNAFSIATRSGYRGNSRTESRQHVHQSTQRRYRLVSEPARPVGMKTRTMQDHLKRRVYQELLDFVDLTLTKMAYGGLFDAVDGGLHRVGR